MNIVIFDIIDEDAAIMSRGHARAMHAAKARRQRERESVRAAKMI